MRQVTIQDLTRGTQLGNSIAMADTSLSRLVGLIGKKSLKPGSGLLIVPSSGIHTFGMRFTIDVVALSKTLEVMHVWSNLAPFRVTNISWKAQSFLELPAGQIEKCKVECGDQFSIS